MILAHKAWPINLYSFRVGHAVKSCIVGFPQHRSAGEGRGAGSLSFNLRPEDSQKCSEVARDAASRSNLTIEAFHVLARTASQNFCESTEWFYIYLFALWYSVFTFLFILGTRLVILRSNACWSHVRGMYCISFFDLR